MKQIHIRDLFWLIALVGLSVALFRSTSNNQTLQDEILEAEATVESLQILTQQQKSRLLAIMASNTGVKRELAGRKHAAMESFEASLTYEGHNLAVIQKLIEYHIEAGNDNEAANYQTQLESKLQSSLLD